MFLYLTRGLFKKCLPKYVKIIIKFIELILKCLTMTLKMIKTKHPSHRKAHFSLRHVSKGYLFNEVQLYNLFTYLYLTGIDLIISTNYHYHSIKLMEENLTYIREREYKQKNTSKRIMKSIKHLFVVKYDPIMEEAKHLYYHHVK